MSALPPGAGDGHVPYDAGGGTGDSHVPYDAGGGAGDSHVPYDAGGGAGDSLPLQHVSSPLHLGTSPVIGFCRFGD